jgi:hypothetical protein
LIFTPSLRSSISFEPESFATIDSKRFFSLYGIVTFSLAALSYVFFMCYSVDESFASSRLFLFDDDDDDDEDEEEDENIL